LPTTRDRGFDETATSENALPSQEWIRTYSKELQTEMRTILLLTTSNIFMTITLTVFSLFSALYLGDKFKWNYAAGFACIVAGSFFIFHKW
jgi:uncharacterized protein (DUF486 family)